VGLFGTTREMSVAERQDFLSRLASKHRESASCSDASLEPDTSNAGVAWKLKPERRLRRKDLRWLPKSLFGSLASTDGVDLSGEDDAFRETYFEQGARGRFDQIHEHDRNDVIQALHHAEKNERVGYSSENLFFRVYFGAGGDRARKSRWLHANVHIIRMNGEVCGHIRSQRWVDFPCGTESLGSRIASTFPGYVFAKNKDGKFLFMNARMRQEVGVAMGVLDWLGLSDKELIADEGQQARFREIDQQVLRSGAPHYNIEDVTLNKLAPGGEVLRVMQKRQWLTVKLALPAFPGFGLGSSAGSDELLVFGMAVDVTEDAVFQRLLLAQACYETIFSNHQAAAYVKERDADGQFRYVDVNEEFVKLVGERREWILRDDSVGSDDGSVKGKTTRQVWSSSNLDLVGHMEWQDREVFQGKQDPFKNALRATNRVGGGVEYRTTTKMVVKDNHGDPRYIMGLSMDVPLYREALSADFYLRGKHLPLEELNVAMMFCDIRSFSLLAAVFRSEQSVFEAFYRRFVNCLTHLSLQHGCVLEKMTGDGAFFLSSTKLQVGQSITRYSGDSEAVPPPPPVDDTEACIRLARLALDICRAFDVLVREWQLGLNDCNKLSEGFTYVPGVRMACGLHFGRASVGWVVDDEQHRSVFVAMGSDVNTTQRIESVAGRGRMGCVLASSVVACKISREFQLRMIEISDVKDGTVAIAEVLGRRKEFL
jgi:class 3 adenylate cyclase/PAS domain-containing protein